MYKYFKFNGNKIIIVIDEIFRIHSVNFNHLTER